MQPLPSPVLSGLSARCRGNSASSQPAAAATVSVPAVLLVSQEPPQNALFLTP